MEHLLRLSSKFAPFRSAFHAIEVGVTLLMAESLPLLDMVTERVVRFVADSLLRLLSLHDGLFWYPIIFHVTFAIKRFSVGVRNKDFVRIKSVRGSNQKRAQCTDGFL